MREMTDRGKGTWLTTEFADEGESSIQLPSYEDVQKDLKRVRQQEGASVRRISTYGQSLQQLRISQEEFRRGGSQPDTLPMATITALECAVRSFEPESVHFIVLNTTLNFRGAPANLTERQQTVMGTLDVFSKTTYDLYERGPTSCSLTGFSSRRDRSAARGTTPPQPSRNCGSNNASPLSRCCSMRGCQCCRLTEMCWPRMYYEHYRDCPPLHR